MVELRELTDEDFEAALAIDVVESQRSFVAEYSPAALVILAKTQVSRWGMRWEALGIYTDGELVGLVGLGVTPDGHEARFFHLLVSTQFQGRGVGRAAVSAIIERARDKGCRLVSLTVSPDNSRALGLYLSLGFEANGVEIDGEQVMTIPV